MPRFSLLRTSLTAVLLTAALTLGASAASFGTGTVDASALRLRSEPSATSTVLTQAYRGTTVDVLADAVDGWYQVSCNGKVGYMSAEYLIVTPLATSGETTTEEPVESTPPAEETTPEQEGTPEEKPAEETAALTGRVTMSYSSTLNIRAAASAGSTKLGSVPNGTILTLEDYVDGWYLITYNGVTGYVSGEYVVQVDPSKTASALGSDIVTEALKYVGCSYRYGGTGPTSFDCSGFTSYVYRQLGYTIQRTASSQLNSNGTAVSRSELQPGDLVFFRDYGVSSPASHVGIYIGNNQFIHAASSRYGVIVSSLSQNWYANRYVGARRIV